MASGDTEVAIIGAGAAGIAAARRLRAMDIDCLLIEARPRLGGGWLHSADGNPWREIAEAEGLAIDRTPPPWMRPALPIGFPLADQAAFREALQRFRRRVD